MKTKLIIIALMVLLLGVPAFAQTDTPTPTNTATPTNTPTATPGANDTTDRELLSRSQGVDRVEFNWIADVTGAATVTTAGFITGELVRVVFVNIQGGVGTYDVTITDNDGADILVGGGSAIAEAVATVTQLTPVTTTKIQTMVFNTPLTFTVVSASSRQTAKTILYFKRY